MQKVGRIILLMLAGETIFLLPFVVARVFRPTLLEVFQIDNLQLGTAFSVYGIVATICYFPSGFIADRFKTKNLIALALIATGIGGCFFASIPSIMTLRWIYGFWGMTTILLFWSALMKATREWGSASRIGMSFGLLDGGRGLTAALTGVLMVFCFEQFQEDCENGCAASAFSNTLWIAVVLTFFVGVLCWMGLVKQHKYDLKDPIQDKQPKMRMSMRNPLIWIQGFIILCAYCCYKGTDDFSLYAYEVLKLDEVQSAKIGALTLWLRPIGAILIGYLADRTKASTMTILSFSLIGLGSIVLSQKMLISGTIGIFFTVLGTTALGIYALRGLYFAIMGEGKVPLNYTGRVVGLISVIGYLPDIFFSPIMGAILDANPGEQGHFNLFRLIILISLLGILATLIFRKTTKVQAHLS
ncbi:MAG: MFS transporter [Flavobacteriales bacterium]|nr:MFS transporter [Flavobacteriales bacterium]